MAFVKPRLILQRGTRADQPAATDVAEGTLYAVTDEGVVERSSGAAWQSFAATGSGDVVGPASSVDDRIATFDGLTGKLLQDGGATIAEVLALALAAALAQQEAIDDEAWTSIAHGDLTFSAQTGTWTVASGDLAYFKYRKIGTRVFLKGAIVTSSVSSTPTELRVTVPGVTFAGNDSFGFTVYSQDGFASQDCGQSICRVSSGLLVFKPRVGGTWLTTTDLTAVIWNLVGECAA